MRVIVSDVAFDGRAPDPLLFRLLAFAYETRHRVIVERGSCFTAWRAALPEKARDEYDAALDQSLELEAREPSEREILIGPRPGATAIEDAIEQLERPFFVLVEDEESDRSFIVAVSTPQHRARLLRMHQRGWLVFRSQGGISKIARMIRQRLQDFPDDKGRMFALFDSDAPAPGEPSGDARDARDACVQTGITFRMLARRSIENYLTRAALTVWANVQAARIDELKAKIEALYGDWFDKQPERRHHFHMKGGLQKMRPRRPLYDGISPDIERKLSHGFGPDLAQAFAMDGLREVDLRSEGSWDELSEMVEALVRSMR
jgi:hypothetical protein